jgi:hypothetical protein
MNRTIVSMALALVAFVAGGAAIIVVAKNPFHWVWMHRIGHALLASGDVAEEEVSGLWTCSMHPEIVRDAPGSCPICGMDLVPIDAPSTAAGESAPIPPGAVRIDPVAVQNIGVRSEPVVRRDLSLGFRTVGHLEYDESQMHWVNAKFEGWIEKAHANYVGERVEQGSPLVEIYSPDLVATQ